MVYKLFLTIGKLMQSFILQTSNRSRWVGMVGMTSVVLKSWPRPWAYLLLIWSNVLLCVSTYQCVSRYLCDHSLQKKVQQCLDDGVRSPMQDLKQLEVENAKLLEQQDHSSKVASQTYTCTNACTRILKSSQRSVNMLPLFFPQLIEHQREQIERLTSQLTVQ